MNRIKIFCVFFISIFFFQSLFSFDFAKADELYNKGLYKDGLDLIINKVDPKNPDLAIIWRVSRFYYEIADAMPKKSKDEKLAAFSKGMEVVEPFLKSTSGKKSDRAQVIFWYAVNFGSKSEVIGIFESLGNIPTLFELANKCIELDPTFGPAYLFMGRIDDTLPTLVGGDKFKMSVNFSQAIKYEPEDMNVVVDAANAYMKRNWDVDKKKEENEKHKKSDGSPDNLTDKEHAKNLLKKALSIYEKKSAPTARETAKYNEAKKLLGKLK